MHLASKPYKAFFALITLLWASCCLAMGNGDGAASKTTPNDKPINAPADTSHSIYLVRHAEKQKGKNPALTSQGHCRARFYAQYFSGLTLDRLFSSKYRRNQETSGPIAKQQNLTPLTFDPNKQTDFARQLSILSGDTLVVAHNHLSEIIRALGGNFEGNIDHSEYRFIFKLELLNGKLVKQRKFIGPNLNDKCQ